MVLLGQHGFGQVLQRLGVLVHGAAQRGADLGGLGGRAGRLGDLVDQARQDGPPQRVARPAHRLQRRHAMGLGQRDAVLVGAGRLAVLQGAVLGVDQVGHQPQVVAHRAFGGQMAQTRGARGEHAGALGQLDAGNAVVV